MSKKECIGSSITNVTLRPSQTGPHKQNVLEGLAQQMHFCRSLYDLRYIKHNR